MPVYKSRFHFT